MEQTATPSPGWYPDPTRGGDQRYWDGHQWTAHTAPMSAPNKKRLSAGAIIGIVAGALALCGLVAAVVAVPIFVSQRAKEADNAARADVAALGYEIATYYVDNEGPTPTITLEDGRYDFGGVEQPPESRWASRNVKFGGQSGDEHDSWCIWVTTPKGELKDFRATALGGVEPGTC